VKAENFGLDGDAPHPERAEGHVEAPIQGAFDPQGKSGKGNSATNHGFPVSLAEIVVCPQFSLGELSKLSPELAGVPYE
jgi:hypothetical protein